MAKRIPSKSRIPSKTKTGAAAPPAAGGPAKPSFALPSRRKKTSYFITPVILTILVLGGIGALTYKPVLFAIGMNNLLSRNPSNVQVGRERLNWVDQYTMEQLSMLASRRTPELRIEAARGLGRWQNTSFLGDSISAIRKVAGDNNYEVKKAAYLALAELGEAPQARMRGVETLQDLLGQEEGNTDAELAILGALTRLMTDAETSESVIPTLVPLLARKSDRPLMDAKVRYAAASAIRSGIRPLLDAPVPAATAVQGTTALLRRVEDPDGRVRDLVLDALETDWSAPQAFPLLLEVMKAEGDENFMPRTYAFTALSKHSGIAIPFDPAQPGASSLGEWESWVDANKGKTEE